MVEKSAIIASTFLFSFKYKFFKNKDTVFLKFQRRHVIGGLNVDASVGKGGKWGGGGAEDD